MNKKFLLKPVTSPLLLGRLYNTLVGLIFMTVGVINFTTKSVEIYMIVLNSILILLGIYYVLTGVFLMAPASRYVPRVEIDPSGILVKDDIFHRSKFFTWDQLIEVGFGIHQLSLKTKSGDTHVFKLNPREEEINTEIKSAIAEIENEKNIIITTA